MSRKEKLVLDAAVAVEIDHLAEDLLDAADTIERLTRKYSEEVQTILRLQAQNIKALTQNGPRDAGDEGAVIIDD